MEEQILSDWQHHPDTEGNQSDKETLAAVFNLLTELLQEMRDTRICVKRLEKQMANLEQQTAALEAAQAELEQDVINVNARFDTLSTQLTETQNQVAALQQIITDMQGNLPTPEIQARLDAVAVKLAGVNTALDAIAPDPVVPPAPVP